MAQFKAFQFDTFQQGTFDTVATELVDQSASGSASLGAAIGSAASTQQQAQSFVPSVDKVSYVVLKLYRSGAPSDDLIVELQTNGATKPSGTVIGTSVTLAASTVPVDHTSLAFFVDVAVTPSTKYWIVARRSGAVDGNAVYWEGNVSNVYASGGLATMNTGVWGAEHATFDDTFSTYYSIGFPFPGRVLALQAVNRSAVW